MLPPVPLSSHAAYSVWARSWERTWLAVFIMLFDFHFGTVTCLYCVYLSVCMLSCVTRTKASYYHGCGCACGFKFKVLWFGFNWCMFVFICHPYRRVIDLMRLYFLFLASVRCYSIKLTSLIVYVCVSLETSVAVYRIHYIPLVDCNEWNSHEYNDIMPLVVAWLYPTTMLYVNMQQDWWLYLSLFVFILML